MGQIGSRRQSSVKQKGQTNNPSSSSADSENRKAPVSIQSCVACTSFSIVRVMYLRNMLIAVQCCYSQQIKLWRFFHPSTVRSCQSFPMRNQEQWIPKFKADNWDQNPFSIRGWVVQIKSWWLQLSSPMWRVKHVRKGKSHFQSLASSLSIRLSLAYPLCPECLYSRVYSPLTKTLLRDNCTRVTFEKARN